MIHNIKDVKIVDISSTGIVSKTTILEPGVTEIPNIQDTVKVLDRNSKIHIHEIDLKISDASVITLFLGDKAIYERELTAAGEVHSIDRDIYMPDNNIRVLSISVSTNVTVTGRIFYSIEYTGGNVVKASANIN